MTGYSTQQAQTGEFSVSVSIKSINHRYLDVQMRVPPALEFFEPQARRLLKEHVGRGHLEVSINLDQHGEVELKVDRKLLEAYVRTCQALREEFGLSSEPDLVALLRIPGVVAGDGVLSQQQDSLRAALQDVLVEAITRLNEMREREGEALARDSAARLKKLAGLAARARKLTGRVAEAYRQRLEKRVRELNSGETADPSRLAQEIALLCNRSDITEEITRFESHVVQARSVLEGGQETGKKLDFLLQEMNREANTILAKTTDIPGPGAEIAASALEMKVEIEKLREQAQNIE